MPTLQPPSLDVIADRTARTSNKTELEIRPHPNDPRWQLATRIAESGSLGRSRLLSRFLLYIVDRHIQQRTDEMTEQQIGVLVFDRKEGYDSNEDNIVRSYARNLRRRIDEYYSTEGRSESLRLEIPRGGYAPCFVPVVQDAGADSAIEAQSSPEETDTLEALSLSEVKAQPRHVVFWKIGTIVALCVGLAMGWFLSKSGATGSRVRQKHASPDEIASNVFWSQMFPEEGDTYVVPSDDGLVIMQRLTERPVPLASYINGDYRKPKLAKDDAADAEILKLGARRYTSVVDLNFVSRVSQLSAVEPARMVVRYARDLRMDDLRGGNAVLIGSIESNPWIQLFIQEMNFRQIIHTDPTQPSGFANTHPQPGEQSIYTAQGRDHTYGLVAFLPNLNATGHVLIVGGLNSAGTQAATTFLLTPSLMSTALKHARESNGHVRGFELLIEANSFAANASAPKLVAERMY